VTVNKIYRSSSGNLLAPPDVRRAVLRRPVRLPLRLVLWLASCCRLRLPVAVAFSIAFAVSLWMGHPSAHAARVKDLVEIKGFRSNPLSGYGLVVGLQGTGDFINSNATRKTLAQLMRHLGVEVPPSDIRARNVAMVLVTGDLPPFAKPGARIDVTVSASGTARSLQGGTLVTTSLKGVDRRTYALAQGPLSLGGFEFSGFTGSTSRKNHTNVGRVPGGGIVEREAPAKMPSESLELFLREPDFTTAARMAEAVNAELGKDLALARDGGSVVVTIDDEFKETVAALVARVESVQMEPDVRARVVINERTGTVVVGSNVTLSPAAVAHGGLSVDIQENIFAVPPAPFTRGGATTFPQTNVAVDEEKGKLKVVEASATVGDVAAALNALGVSPRDLIPILQALRAAGALQAELQIL